MLPSFKKKIYIDIMKLNKEFSNKKKVEHIVGFQTDPPPPPPCNERDAKPKKCLADNKCALVHYKGGFKQCLNKDNIV